VEEDSQCSRWWSIGGSAANAGGLYNDGSPRNSAAKIVEILQPRSALHREENLYEVRNAFLGAQPPVRPAISVRTQPGAISTIARESLEWRAAKLRMSVFNAALLPRYTSRMPVVLLLTLPCPDDITPIVPVGETRSCRASMTRIGLSAFVTMTRTNSSVCHVGDRLPRIVRDTRV